jgi:hypothetical protein
VLTVTVPLQLYFCMCLKPPIVDDSWNGLMLDKMSDETLQDPVNIVFHSGDRNVKSFSGRMFSAAEAQSRMWTDWLEF